ncbi:MAG TPA: TonB-dependent receptor [Prolixibacteraceae bacterium]|nr:TonB-dependent receptor [Prolixibacteraceae bacterium]
MMTLKNKPAILLLMLIFLSMITFAQEATVISGRVTDQSGNPIDKVTVSVLDEFTQVSTDNSGDFTLSAPLGKVLLFSKIGYLQQQHPLTNNNALTIQLLKENPEPVYNVAYGVRSQSELTSAISTISAEDLSKAPVSTLGNAIQGLGSGLTVLRTVGAEPGWDQPNIFIRGVQTFGGGASPLVMVDNVERDFTQLDPEEIETFTILKDAAATAQYGMRGANGVILVTTKKGFIGKPEVSLTAQYGMQSATRLPKYANAQQYVTYRNLALRNDYSKLSDPEFNSLFMSDPRNNPDNYNGSNLYLYPNTDWYDSFIKSSAPQQSYKLSFRGGTEIAQYYVMLGVLDQKGLYNYSQENSGFSTQNDFSRYNFRTAVDVNVSKTFKVGVNLGGRVENRHVPNTGAGTIISALSKLPATMPIFNEDQSLAGSAIYKYNPYGMIARSGFQDRFARYIQGTTTADLKLDGILKGLSANALFGFDATKNYGRSKNQSYAVYQQNADNTYTQFGEGTSIDLGYSGWDNTFGLMLNYMFGLSYDRTLGVNHLAGDVKYMQSSESVEGDNPDFRNQGVFGRATYSYDKRYTAEFGFAYNGSENFAKDRRFGFFPTLSAAWVISNESFLKDSKTLSFLKLRGSYGKVGNSNIGIGYRFPYEEKYYSGNGYYFGTAGTDGAYEGRIANPTLTWEESLNGNIGLEIGLFKALEVDVDVFHNDRSQIITGRWNTLPSFIGQDLPYENNGSVLSKGFEIVLKHSKKIGDFSYLVQGNISYTTNKITAQEEVAGMNPWEYRTGQEVMQQWGLAVSPDKFFKDQADIDSYAKSSYGTNQPGDVKYIDQNGDGVIDSQDYVPMGNPSVPEYNFGLTLGLGFKGFDFNVLLTGIANRSLFMNNNVFWGMQDNNNITTEVADNSWGVSENPIYPRLTTQLNAHNYQPSSLWLKELDYLRIQTMEIGYSLPKKLLSKANINDVRFFVNGYNLFSFDTMKKYNVSPEIPNAGVTLYPEVRVINIGANLKF